MLSNKDFYDFAKNGVVILFYKRGEYIDFLEWMRQFLEDIAIDIIGSDFPDLKIFDSVQNGTYPQSRRDKPIHNEIFSVEMRCRLDREGFIVMDCGWMPNSKWFSFTSPYKNYKYFDYSKIFDSSDIIFQTNFYSLIA